MDTNKSDSREELYKRHLKVPFEVLQSDLLNLAVRIQYFRELFTEDASRVELLNRIASTFFFVVQQALLTEMVFGFSRVTDRAQMGSKQNLSLPFFIEKIEELQLEEASNLVVTLREKKCLIDASVVRLRKIRDKRLAHRDLEHALQIDSELGESLEAVEEAFERVGSFMNEIELFFTDSTSEYSTEFLASRNGAMCLIDALERSIGETSQGEEM